MSPKGVFVVEYQPNTDKLWQRLDITHSCTDSGVRTTEIFRLSLFAEHQRERYTTLSQGYFFLPVSSHDATFTRTVAESLAFAKYFSRTEKKSVPQTMLVDGKTSSKQQPGIRVVGRLFNWEWESMPEPSPSQTIDQAFINSTRIPLNFVGRVKVGVEETVALSGGERFSCHGVKMALYRNESEVIM